jgi:hypothetical protein
MSLTKRTIIVSTFLTPLAASAALNSLKDLLRLFMDFIQFAMAILMALLSLGVIVLTFKYINAARSGKEDKTMRDRMIWTIVGTAVVFTLWGLVRVLSSTFDIAPGIPQFHI